MENLRDRIGFMQGRLSDLINGRIQTFPEQDWESEFLIAREIKLPIMEWTIDSLTFSNNPLVNSNRIDDIVRLSSVNRVTIPSVTCDYYMENPHWKSNNRDIEGDIQRIIEAMPKVGARILVMPLVDNSSIARNQNMDLKFFQNLENLLLLNNVRIAFELDLGPEGAKKFIESFDESHYGINYDIGNSASLGFDPEAEISSYGNRILNIHVKDRPLGGHTVPLGSGSVDFKKVVEQLTLIDYRGNFIMQTARSKDGKHTDELLRTVEFFERALLEY
jgi:hexulose-6-phosphate isomerase